MTDGDDELLARWRGGDVGAGNQLFLRYFTAVRRFFVNKVPADEVEDLIQRTFTGCIEARERIREGGSVRSFLFGVAYRQLYKFLRDRAAAARRAEVDFSVSSVRDLGQTPTSMLAQRRRQEILLEALQRVSVDHQTILELCYWEELSGAELAEALDIPAATVRTRLFRGRQALEAAVREIAGAASGDELEHELRELGRPR